MSWLVSDVLIGVGLVVLCFVANSLVRDVARLREWTQSHERVHHGGRIVGHTPVDAATRKVIANFIARESGWPVNAPKVQELTDVIIRRSGGNSDLAMCIAVETVDWVNRSIDQERGAS